MIMLMSKHMHITQKTKVLDLACGKGAASIQIANQFGCKVKGVDLMLEFVQVAKEKVKLHYVESLCDFELNDISLSVMTEKGYDIVIIGAVGDVLGNQAKTLHLLSQTISDSGFVLLDDGYAKAERKDAKLTRAQWLNVIKSSGFEIVEDLLIDQEDL